ncbi:MAG TPA: hypothetical protein VJU83_00390 [Burkholderiales bacterium]|nr:hypothetical protein [Burkholderiales bacterium]
MNWKPLLAAVNFEPDSAACARACSIGGRTAGANYSRGALIGKVASLIGYNWGGGSSALSRP